METLHANKNSDRRSISVVQNSSLAQNSAGSSSCFCISTGKQSERKKCLPDPSHPPHPFSFCVSTILHKGPLKLTPYVLYNQLPKWQIIFLPIWVYFLCITLVTKAHSNTQTTYVRKRRNLENR